MSGFGLAAEQTGVFLFEDHKIARASFLLPDNCRKVSTRAFLMFLEQHGMIESAAAIERRATLADSFSTGIAPGEGRPKMPSTPRTTAEKLSGTAYVKSTASKDPRTALMER
jgi:hypothetical protein